MTKSVRMLNSSSNLLDKILQIVKKVGNNKGIGYTHRGKAKNKLAEVNFIPGKGKQKISDQTPQHPQKHLKNNQRCYYYGRLGHIKFFCYRLHGYPKIVS